MKNIIYAAAAAAVLLYIVIVTVNLIKKNGVIKGMQRNIDTLRYSVLDSEITRTGMKPEPLLKLTIDGGESYYFESGRQVICGRQYGCDVCIDNSSVSKEHCCLYFKNNQLFVKDLNSSNFTVILRGGGKTALAAREVRELLSGDRLYLGNVSALVQIFYCIAA